MKLAFAVMGILAGAQAQMYKKVKLKDVNTLTLYQGKMTNGRRSAPVPQLTCHGGSAGCNAFIPDVVQCYNRGSDGLDVQWECKTEMANEFKFGKIQVSCEGYDYPEDEYILAGSCGLEYTIDRTGVNQGNSQNNHGGSSYSSNGWNNGKSYTDTGDSSSNIGYIIFFAFVAFILYRAIFSPTEEERPPPYNPEYTRVYPDIPPAGSSAPEYNSQPPPYSNNAGNTRHRGSASGNGGWSNFTSFGTGWMASDWWNGRNRRPRNNWGSSWGSGWGNTHTHETHHHHHHRSPSPNRSKSSSSSSNSSSSGTRTTSGFGGTSRR